MDRLPFRLRQSDQGHPPPVLQTEAHSCSPRRRYRTDSFPFHPNPMAAKLRRCAVDSTARARSGRIESGGSIPVDARFQLSAAIPPPAHARMGCGDGMARIPSLYRKSSSPCCDRRPRRRHAPGRTRPAGLPSARPGGSPPSPPRRSGDRIPPGKGRSATGRSLERREWEFLRPEDDLGRERGGCDFPNVLYWYLLCPTPFRQWLPW
mmetsp:Transcript_6703/g.16503  ORF Transcript_6703/g.16503 Transcript_6703/m.16503 type:complete len:207 (-) Transcript_6703:1243-1863(-)